MMGLLVLVGLFVVGCMARRTMMVPENFVVPDPIIAEALREAISEWASLGVERARGMTVNASSEGVPVVRSPRAELWRKCSLAETYAGDGCSAYDDWRWTGIFIPSELTNYDRLRVVMLHELGHILSEEMGHIEDAAGPAVMTLNATSSHPTDADLEWMAARTIVDSESAESPS